LLQGVVVPLLLAAVIVLSGLAAECVQHPPDHLGALAGQVPVQNPGAAERGGQLHAAVSEVPVRVLIGPLGPGRSYISANSAASSSSPSPPAAAATRASSASSRTRSGSLSVHTQISRPTDSEIFPAASAASTRGCVATRLAHALCPTAAP